MSGKLYAPAALLPVRTELVQNGAKRITIGQTKYNLPLWRVLSEHDLVHHENTDMLITYLLLTVNKRVHLEVNTVIHSTSFNPLF
jgi:hypothetical protein